MKSGLLFNSAQFNENLPQGKRFKFSYCDLKLQRNNINGCCPSRIPKRDGILNLFKFRHLWHFSKSVSAVWEISKQSV